MVGASWDSGPYSTFHKSNATEEKTDWPNGYGDHTVLVPRDVFERYQRAESELHAAEGELRAAVEDSLRRLGRGR